MGKMKKLLYRPLRAFVVFSLIVLAFSIPVYYIVVETIWLEELDDHNEHIKERLERQLGETNLPDDSLRKVLHIWNVMQPGTRIEPVQESDVKEEETYTVMRPEPDSDDPEEDRFRGLSAYVKLNGKPYHLVVETNVEEADETLAAITLVTISFFVVLVAGFIILNRIIAKRSWKGFYETLDRLAHFDLAEQKPLALGATDILEFYELNTRLKQLTDSNLAAFSRQKKFIENASHELQTPFAILKTKLDLLYQDGALHDRQAEAIEAIQKQISRVSRINRNLLLLAKIENLQFAESERINLVFLIRESATTLQEMYLSEGHIQIDLPDEFWVNGNRTLVEILVSNLLINALVHNHENGEIQISLKNNQFEVSNPGLKTLDEEAVFQRFAISTDRATSSGLGLAIVKEICDRMGWKVGYGFEEGRHGFWVRF